MRFDWCAWVLIAVVGCDSLSEFDTGDSEIYTGVVAGVNDPEVCPDGIDCSFIRRGFPSGTQLDLQFDPFAVDNQPGTISTRGENCAPTFDNTQLLPIPPLAHDQLGLYEIPGRGRLRNYMFVARPEAGPLAGRDAMVFVSLIRGGAIEVRVVAGPGLTICDPDD
ncbi:MAG: hypothetical protein WBG86_23480, partial [Polyangiales bacterium]